MFFKIHPYSSYHSGLRVRFTHLAISITRIKKDIEQVNMQTPDHENPRGLLLAQTRHS